MSRMRRNDYKAFGCNAYKEVIFWEQLENQWFASLSPIEFIISTGNTFKDIYVEYKVIDENGDEIVKRENVGVSDQQLYEDYIARFSERLMTLPYYFDSDAGNKAQMGRLHAMVNSVLVKNRYKYLTLIASMGLKWDPLYDKNGSVVKDGYLGKTTESREQDENGYNLTIESDQVQVAAGQGDDNVNVSIWVDNNANATTSTKSGTTGGLPTKKHYSTTYDDASTGRLEYYDEETGTHTETEKHAPRAKIDKYKDPNTTVTKEQRAADGYHEEIKTTETTMEAEKIRELRDLAYFSIEEEFFRDINKEILLQLY